MSDALHPEQSSGVSLVERLPAADFPVRLVDIVVESSIKDKKSDRAEVEDALCEALGAADITIPIPVIRDLGETLREADGKVTVTVRSASGTGEKWEVTRVRPAADAAPWYVAVLDIGPVTVWGQLLDGETGRVVVTAAAGSAREALDKMGSRCGAAQESIEHVVVAGGTSSVLRFLGPEAREREVDPHAPPWADLSSVSVSTLELGPFVCARAVVKAVPAVSESVGGDIVAGVLVSGAANVADLCLYVDMGPDGAAVVGNRERLVVTPLAAGGVFEGVGLSHGMAAVSGAIERVTIDPATLQSTVSTIDDGVPRGICGSGVMDTVAGLLATGVVTREGRFAPDSGSPSLKERGGRLEYVLVPAGCSSSASDIVLAESDVEKVMQATAAMVAEMTALLESVSVEWDDLRKVVIGTISGRFLIASQLVSLGVFPEIDPAHFEFVGNGSLLGARAVATSRRLEGRAEQVASLMREPQPRGDLVSLGQ
ncbi:MAG: DUF4445 domain-containing protein [Thermoleophilia bacterium]|nr:DUF4445 domain-containing protein [Thermoleophilia bacterium]